MDFYSTFKKESLPSLVSSSIAVSIMSPLEVLRIQAQCTGSNLPIPQLYKNIVTTHGYSGFYKGMVATLASQPLYWTCYFPVYHYISDTLSNKKRIAIKNIKEVDSELYEQTSNTSLPSYEKKKLTFFEKIFAVSVASSFSGFIVNPLFVFKTRFQTSALSNTSNTNYTTLISNMIKNEGIRGFYKGNLVAQFKNTQMVIQMPLYDYFTSHEVIHTLTGTSDKNYTHGGITFGMGCLAKLISSTIYYPLDNIRTNIRRHEQHKSIPKIMSEIYSRPGGIINFYRGVGLYWISAVPTFGLIMYSYEKIKALSN